MTTTIPATRTPSGLAPLAEPARRYVAASRADNTRRVYRTAFRCFASWCEARSVQPLPAAPATVSDYLAELADTGRAASTVAQRRAAIRAAHAAAGVPSPTDAPEVAAVMAGIRRSTGTAPRKVAPATSDRVAAMTATLPRDTTKGLRDRALLLLGFAGAFRRSELVGLEVADLEETERGLLVTVRRSKTDQEAAGHTRAIVPGRKPETCPLRALAAWRAAAGVEAGPLFRSMDRWENVRDRALSGRDVARVVKAAARAAGLDPSEFSGHSLRAGFVTSAAEAGASLERTMDHTGHRSVAVVRGYYRRVSAFDGHPGEGLL